MATENVTVCTLLPLTAKTVTGTVSEVAEDEALSVRTEFPLVKVGELKLALTPEGSRSVERWTVPKPNDFSPILIAMVPFDM